jgi:Subtilase family
MAIVAAAGNHGVPPVTAQVLGEKPKAAPAAASIPLFGAALDGVLAVGARDEKWAPWTDGFCRGRDVDSAYLGDSDEQQEEAVQQPEAEPQEQVGEWVDLSLEDEEPGSRRAKFYGWPRWTGTSFATAHASARIAELIAAEGKSPQEALKAVREDPEFHRR